MDLVNVKTKDIPFVVSAILRKGTSTSRKAICILPFLVSKVERSGCCDEVVFF